MYIYFLDRLRQSQHQNDFISSSTSVPLSLSVSFFSSINSQGISQSYTYSNHTPSVLVLFYMSAQNSANNEEQANKIKNNICMYHAIYICVYERVLHTKNRFAQTKYMPSSSRRGQRGGGGGFKNCRQTN